MMLILGISAGVVFVFFAEAPHVGTALVWAAGCLAAGFLVGFLFGIPPLIQQAAATDKSKPLLGVNTNLHQIGDWLTKILVGVTLVQLGRLPDLILKASRFIGSGIGEKGYESLAGGILIYFSAAGFLSGYLWAVLKFGKEYQRAVTETAGLDETTARKIRDAPLAEADAPAAQLDGLVKPLEGDAAAAAQKMAKLPLDQVPKEAAALEAWARGQFDQREYKKAVEGYQRVVEVAPTNARLRHRYAIALKYALEPQTRVVEELRKAAESPDGADSQLRADIVNSLTFNDLYLAPPESFERTIEDAEKYLSTLLPELRGAVLVNLACAYGQKARRNQIVEGSKEEYLQLRAKALDAVRNAIRVDAGWRPRLAALLDPNDEQIKQGEDDLAVFRDDAEFRETLGLPPRPAPAGAAATAEQATQPES